MSAEILNDIFIYGCVCILIFLGILGCWVPYEESATVKLVRKQDALVQ